MKRIKTFAELHDAFKDFKLPSYWLFRGQSDSSWDLRPKCARPPYCMRDDQDMFALWKRKAIELCDNPPDDDWHWLALAQHHGFATRLLDWSSNPLVAAFFACKDNVDEDGAIFAYLGSKYIMPQSFKQGSPWDVKDPTIFHPFIKNRRVHNQGGSFTITSDTRTCFTGQVRDNERIEKIIIDKAYKRELIFELNFYGINWGTLYPDLDGHSKLMNWYVEYGEENFSES
jgi:FRG domain-containing protein